MYNVQSLTLLNCLCGAIERFDTGPWCARYTAQYNGYLCSCTIYIIVLFKVVTQIPGILNKLSITRDISARDTRDKLVEATK